MKFHSFFSKCFQLALGIIVLLSGSLLNAEGRFPFVIPGDDASKNATDFSYLSPRPAGQDGFVQLRNGHFFTKTKRLRIWGVNVGYGACFPSHADADQIAAHLAKIGINGIRIHHHESQFSPTGLLNKDGSFNSEQVDRLDYFLAQLHAHGIYANLNLHVGRTASKQLKLPPLKTSSHATSGDKYLLHFQPEIQHAFQGFCKEYLEHVNPYRKLRRVDDPGIAMIEMCNENKFSEAGPSLLLSAPQPYRKVIQKKWNDWLKKKYATRSLQAAWGNSSKRPEKTLTDSSQWKAAGQGDWSLVNADPQAKLVLSVQEKKGETILRFVPEAIADKKWKQQFLQSRLTLDAPGDNYTLKFSMRADRPRSVELHLAMLPKGKWESLGLSRVLEVKPEWKTFVFRFKATKKVKDVARLAFSLGGSKVALELKNLSLKTGAGSWKLPDGQSMAAGNIALPKGSAPSKYQAAFHQFMVDTETTFYQQTKTFLQKELGVRVPILTTQINYQPASIAASISDFNDMHSYWHHPIFHGKEWDPRNWTIKNETLLAYPFHNRWPRVNLTMRGGWRIHGQPFTVSEWNTGEPNFFSADAIPIAAILASLQDWDAVFFFDYHTKRENWNTDRIQMYFQINGQPCKTALLAGFANLYRRGDLKPLKKMAVTAPSDTDLLGPLSLRYRIGMKPGLSPENISQTLKDEAAQQLKTRLLETPDRSIRWDARNQKQAHLLINTPKTKCVWGLVGGRSLSVGSWKMKFGKTERDYAIVTATSRDNLALKDSNSILLIALANAENQNMGWNADRTSVGNRWGNGPTMVNGIPLKLTLPAIHKAKKMFALDGRGKRIAEVKGTLSPNGAITFELGPKQKTLWYELTSGK